MMKPVTPISEKYPSTDYRNDWASLRLLNVYRLFVNSVMLVTLHYLNENTLLGQRNLSLFSITLLAYFVLSLVFISSCLYWRWPRFERQVHLQACIDITAITLLMHASGGINSGLGLLMVVTIANTALITMDRCALLFAAFGSLAILSEQLYTQFTYPGETAYVQAGTLGATLLVTALLAMVLARRHRRAAALARQHKTALDNLAEINEQIIQQMDEALLFVNPTGAIRIANSSARELLNITQNTTSLSLPGLSKALASALEYWQRHRSPQPQIAFDRQLGVELRTHFLPLGKAGTLIRMENNFALKQQMLQAKLASLGRLTANIAHEIRNPLGAISHAAQLLDESVSVHQDDKRLVNIVLTQSQRMNKIIEDIMQLSRRQNAVSDKINLCDYLTKFSTDFCRRQQAATVRVNASGTAYAWMDSNHLHQILWNLCTNSLHHGGRENIVIDLVADVSGDSSGHKTTTHLDIRDNGTGIPPDIHEKVFEPFYTSSHRGTGLGLYIVRELCELNRAHLALLPRDNGTCFRIAFGSPPETTR